LLIIEVGVDGSCVGVVMEVMDIDTGDICGLVGEIEASTAMDSRVMTIGTGVLVWDKGVSVESEVLAGAVVDVSVGTTAAAIGGTRVRVGGIGCIGQHYSCYCWQYILRRCQRKSEKL